MISFLSILSNHFVTKGGSILALCCCGGETHKIVVQPSFLSSYTCCTRLDHAHFNINCESVPARKVLIWGQRKRKLRPLPRFPEQRGRLKTAPVSPMSCYFFLSTQPRVVKSSLKIVRLKIELESGLLVLNERRAFSPWRHSVLPLKTGPFFIFPSCFSLNGSIKR